MLFRCKMWKSVVFLGLTVFCDGFQYDRFGQPVNNHQSGYPYNNNNQWQNKPGINNSQYPQGSYNRPYNNAGGVYNNLSYPQQPGQGSQYTSTTLSPFRPFGQVPGVNSNHPGGKSPAPYQPQYGQTNKFQNGSFGQSNYNPNNPYGSTTPTYRPQYGQSANYSNGPSNYNPNNPYGNSSSPYRPQYGQNSNYTNRPGGNLPSQNSYGFPQPGGTTPRPYYSTPPNYGNYRPVTNYTPQNNFGKSTNCSLGWCLNQTTPRPYNSTQYNNGQYGQGLNNYGGQQPRPNNPNTWNNQPGQGLNNYSGQPQPYNPNSWNNQPGQGLNNYGGQPQPYNPNSWNNQPVPSQPSLYPNLHGPGVPGSCPAGFERINGACRKM